VFSIRLPRPLASLSVAAVLGLGLFITHSSLAADKDAEVKKIDQDALFNDYLGMNFPSAEQKLQKAIKTCGASGCSPNVLATVHRDLGMVYVAGMNDAAKGKSEFVAALKADPSITLDKDLTTPEAQKAFDEAKAEVGAGGAAATPPTEPAATPTEPANPETVPIEGIAEPEKAEPKSSGSECPPDFPGCDAGAALGAYCETSSDCASGLSCNRKKNECVEAAEEESPEAAKFKKFWGSLGFQIDMLMLSAAKNVCNSGDYDCFDHGTYVSENGTVADGVSGRNEIKGGLNAATMRLLLGGEYALSPHLTLGGRLGFAFGGGPKANNGNAFLPVHVEGRLGYYFTSLENRGLRAYGFLGAGAAQVDSKLTMAVRWADTTRQDSNVDVWRKTGLGFVALGAGVGAAISPTFYLGVEPRLQILFPQSGVSPAIYLGASKGF